MYIYIHIAYISDNIGSVCLLNEVYLLVILYRIPTLSTRCKHERPTDRTLNSLLLPPPFFFHSEISHSPVLKYLSIQLTCFFLRQLISSHLVSFHLLTQTQTRRVRNFGSGYTCGVTLLYLDSRTTCII